MMCFGCSVCSPTRTCRGITVRVSFMSERTRKVSKTSRNTPREGSSVETRRSESAHPDHDIESILDEIDDVLEANAEDFVRNYVQKGGE